MLSFVTTVGAWRLGLVDSALVPLLLRVLAARRCRANHHLNCRCPLCHVTSAQTGCRALLDSFSTFWPTTVAICRSVAILCFMRGNTHLRLTSLSG
ncbi:hypothetical protein [Schistocephalus solidus toti-like virus 3]|nr:hypothetical protein [Schistocephalus solidus toti-like virus 3]